MFQKLYRSILLELKKIGFGSLNAGKEKYLISSKNSYPLST
jgi:hypothetical protein